MADNLMNGKQKLVVVGNGMAGARTVEEILARGGGEQFDITMFGDEPYGNYNRILLSNVLNGTQDAADIFLNPLEWYTENNVTLHAPARVTHIDRARKEVHSDDGQVTAYDKLMIATGSRPFVPPMEGLETPEG
ncbi:MAG: FAD-dependent oxidoreductase, partial [Janthinobacterium lividum]